jgi:5-methylcytosine-specific restriction endonuclease McrA
MDGKICKKCNTWKAIVEFSTDSRRADGRHPYCKECKRKGMRDLYAKDPEARRTRSKEWIKANPEYTTAYEAARKGTRAARRKEAAAKRPRVVRQTKEERSARRTAHYESNREMLLARGKAYKDSHRDKLRVVAHNYRTRLVKNGGTYSPADWHALCAWFGNICLCCGAAGNLTVDHVIPVAKGGVNSIDNLQPLCHSCNSSKRDKSTDYRDPVRLAAFLGSL